MIYIVKVKVEMEQKNNIKNIFETIWPVDAECYDEAVYSVKKYYKSLSKKEGIKYNITDIIYANPTLE